MVVVFFFIVQAVGDDLIDSITGENIPIYTEEEKYNQTVLSSVERLEAQLNGKEVPGEMTGHPYVAQAAECQWLAKICAHGMSCWGT